MGKIMLNYTITPLDLLDKKVIRVPHPSKHHAEVWAIILAGENGLTQTGLTKRLQKIKPKHLKSIVRDLSTDGIIDIIEIDSCGGRPRTFYRCTELGKNLAHNKNNDKTPTLPTGGL